MQVERFASIELPAITPQEKTLSTILDKIVATKRDEIAAAKKRVPIDQLQRQVKSAPPIRDFHGALANRESIQLIAEVKKASPSKGVIRADFDPVAIAKIYEGNGAACISVLTDEQYFQGQLSFLTEIRRHTTIPLLRKDFILDEYQIVEARVAGADAVLLIAECLSADELRQLVSSAHGFNMAALVEFYDQENMQKVVDCGSRLCGVNNRDLRSFATDLQHTVRLRKKIPAEMTLVGESGIHTRADVEMLEQAGVDAMLVGESLMASDDIAAAVCRLLGK